MNVLQKISEIINEAQKRSVSLNQVETIHIIEAVKQISCDKLLIEKALYLVLLINKQEPSLVVLSKRENEIFRLIGLGFSSREVSQLISISEATVGTHRKNIIKKLNLSGSGQLQQAANFIIQKKLQT